MLERKHANTFGKDVPEFGQSFNDFNHRDSQANLEMSNNELLNIGSHLEEEKINPRRQHNDTEKQIEETGSSGGTASVELVMTKKKRA